MCQKVTVSVTIFFSGLLLLAGCGSSNELGSVGEQPVTRDEYLAVFNALPAEEQVEVLEPGGRMTLMERIVRKKLLMLAWAEDPAVSNGWEEMYQISFLSDSMLQRIAVEYDSQGYIDFLSSSGYSGFSLRTVLLDDSSQAVSVAELWNAGDFDNSVPSVTAPWSDRTGSSYRTMAGPMHRLTENFEPFLTMEMGRAHVVPMYGEWCVCILELTPGPWTPDESAAAVGLMNLVGSLTGEVVLSKGIEALSNNCSLSGTVLVPTGSGDDTPAVILGTDTLTVNRILGMMQMAQAQNFFGGVPEELAFFSPPQFSISPEVTLWFYTKSVAQHIALRNMAMESGISLQEGALDYARAESVVRERVLYQAIPDSSEVAVWFAANSSEFILPERRSVLLGYTDSLSAAASGSYEAMEDIPGLQTMTDSSGNIVTTPLQVEESFGPVLGPEIFSAEPDVLTGPVFLEGELAGWFKVVEVEPSGVADLEEVFPVAATAAAGAIFQQGFEDLIGELRSSYPVKIDTASVLEVDLWGSV